MPSSGPLKTLRLTALVFAWCFSTATSSVGLNALLNSNDDKSRLKKLVPVPTVVYINTNDISSAGVAATTASILISVLAFNWVATMYMPSTREWCRKSLRLQSFTLLFGCVFLFASMIPYMLFFLNREASVKAFIGTIQLPDAAIRAVEGASGATRIYKKVRYLKLLAIVPWFSLVFTLIAAAVLFVAGGASTQEADTPAAVCSITDSSTKKDDKASVASYHERATV